MPKNQNKSVILCVDDEKIILDSLEDQISSRLGSSIEIETAGGGLEGLEIINEFKAIRRPIALVISDYLMPGMKGDEFLIKVHEKMPETLKILLTGHSTFDAVKNAINNAGLYRYLTKPWDEEDLLLTLESAVKSYEQQGKLKEYNIYTQLLRSLNKAANEISSEININQLVDKFLQIAIDCTEAQRGVLLLKNNGKLKIEAIGEAGRVIANRLTEYSKESLERLTEAMISNIEVLIGNNYFNNRQIASHILNKEVEIGYIYLEQYHADQAFTPYHREMLDMLSSQAAISIENANLYTQLQHKNERIERIMALIEQKNEDILDSIRYAQRIQNSISPSLEILNKFFSQHAILLRPRDIVSGDFYWWQEVNSKFWLACADCTGHGVPGAILSILGVNFFNEIAKLHPNFNSEEILTEIHKHIKDSLNQNSLSTQTNDGMDVALIIYDPIRMIIQFTGANRPLFILRNNEILEFLPNKISIGENEKFWIDESFTRIEIPVQKNDILYLFSDGIVDQFGGDQSKKFTTKRLKEIIIQLSSTPLQEQKEILNYIFDEWRAEREQTDDVLICMLEL